MCQGCFMSGPARGEVFRWYRNMRWIWLNAGWVGVAGILLGVPFTVLFTKYKGPDWPLGALLGLAFTAIGIWASVTGFRAGLGICGDGVLIRQMYGRTRWVPWTEIERFDTALEHTRGDKYLKIVVLLTDKKPLPVSACAFSGKFMEADISAMLNDLENERKKRFSP